MAKLPKLKIQVLGKDISEELCDFEQARYFDYVSTNVIVAVEGQMVRSYDELVNLVTQERYRDKEFLEVTFLPIYGGG